MAQITYSDRKQFGFNLQLWRKIEGYTKEEVCKITGITQNTLNSYEAGQITPNAFVARELASLYGCPIEAFFGDRVQNAWNTFMAEVRKAR